jgi:hypothetical protein
MRAPMVYAQALVAGGSSDSFRNAWRLMVDVAAQSSYSIYT